LASDFLSSYQSHVDERASEGIVPLPLDAANVSDLVEAIKAAEGQELKECLDLLANRVPPGVDEAAYVKAGYLSDVATGAVDGVEGLDRKRAVELLGTMQGGYNVKTLVELLEDSDASISSTASECLKNTLLVFDAFYDVEALHKNGCAAATSVMESWAEAEWFLSRPEVQEKITTTVFKVTGETNTDDLSPAPDAWSRPDIPLHAQAMLKMSRDGIFPDEDGSIGPIKQMNELVAKGHPVSYVGDVVGTGSSRKSATNSILWFFGEDIPYVPNKRTGGLCIGSKIAPIFYNTMEDSGALPIEMDVTSLNTGDVIDVYPYEGVTKNSATGEVICEWELKTQVLLDEVRAGGRIPLIIGRGLTNRARASLGKEPSEVFKKPVDPEQNVSEIDPLTSDLDFFIMAAATITITITNHNHNHNFFYPNSVINKN